MEYLKTEGAYTTDEILRIEKQRNELLSDITRKKLISYIYGQLPNKDDDHEYIGIDRLGDRQNYKLIIPNEILKPRPFNYDMYPLLDNKSMFKTERPYNYLANFNISTFYDVQDKEDVRYNAIVDLLKMQAQSRFTNIWRQLASALFAVDSLNQGEDYPLRYCIKKVLFNSSKPDEFPFFDSNGMQYNNKNISSMLPILTYAFQSIATDICVGTITHIDSVMILNMYLDMAKDSYCDDKLKLKSIVRNCMLELPHNLGETKIPVWTKDGRISNSIIKSTSESAYVRKQIESAKKERKEKLSPMAFNYVNNYIKRVKNMHDVAKVIGITLSSSGDRTFYKTLVELSLDDAVKSRVRSHLVTTPKSVIVDVENSCVYKHEYNIDQVYEYWTHRYLNQYIAKIVKGKKKFSMDELWINFLTTSSAGQKLTVEELQSIPKLARALHNKRLIRQAITARQYTDKKELLFGLIEATNLVVRQQIERRQRAIAGLNNQKLLLSFTSYILGKMLYDVTAAAAQGKQTGNIADIESMLYYTSQVDVLCSSVDISGMDASIQPATKMIYDSFVSEMSKKLPDTKFGPWVKDLRVVVNDKNDKTKEYIKALTQALAYSTSNNQTSTTYKSKYFRDIQNYEGTFESGRADTSTHHTDLLIGAIGGNEIIRSMRSKMNYISNRRMMGDDISIMYRGEEERILEHAIDDTYALKQLGFKVTLDISRNYAIFLQQMVINGSYIGLANRVSFYTREHSKEITSLSKSCQELLALVDDMSSRVENLKGLKVLSLSIGLFCLSRYTVAVNMQDHDAIVKAMSKHIFIQTYKEQEKRVDTRLITIYAPFVWLFMHEGGEMPAVSLYRSDGSVTKDESTYTPRGLYKRRLLFDLSNIKEMILNNNVVLDHTLLKAYGFESAQYLINLNLLDIEKNVKVSDLSKLEILDLATDLESIGDQTSRVASGRAYVELKYEGVSLPQSIVYAFNLRSKIEQVALSEEKTDFQIGRISQKIKEKVLSMKDKEKFIQYVPSKDVLHLYDFHDKVDQYVPLLPHAKYIKDTMITYNLFDYTATWMLYVILGGTDFMGNELKKAISSMRGKYHDFKYDDPVFVTGLDIWHNKRHLLNLYFTAINAGDKQKSIFVAAFKYYDKYQLFTYKYILSPRQLFIISDNPQSAERCYETTNISTTRASKQLRGMLAIYTYLEILSKAFSYTGSVQILTLHQDLLSYLYKAHEV